jgi:tRNA threonylcarbamoyl adenosine modification protein (Sua5/YciO/YrdC/YwlC family)
MLITIHHENPNSREIKMAVDCLRDGGVVISPTDSVYAFIAAINQPRAVERIIRIIYNLPEGSRVDIEKENFSVVCNDLSHLSDFTKPISNSVFKAMRKALPGPFTFILDANNNVPKIFKSKKKQVGIRVPDNKIIQEIVSQLGMPVLSKSVHDEDEVLDYITDAELIETRFGKFVDYVIDGGAGHLQPSTIVDCTSGECIIVRQGLGEL